MKFLTDMKKELILDWDNILMEQVPHLKAAALKAYYIKLRLYRYRQKKNLELGIA